MPKEITCQPMSGSILRSRGLILAVLNLGLAFIAVYVPRAPIYQAYSTNKQCPDVIIVGAGIAGLEAARELQDSRHSVLIFERNGRTGGRGFVGGIGDKNTPIDYGGAWIHGVDKNPLTKLVGSMRFERRPTRLDLPYFCNSHKATKKEKKRFYDAVDEYEKKVKLAALAEYAYSESKKGVPRERICGVLERSIPSSEISRLGDLCHGPLLSPEEFRTRADRDLGFTSDVAKDYVPDGGKFGEDVIALLVANAGPLESAVELNETSAVDAGNFIGGDKDGGDYLVDGGMGAFVEKLRDGVQVSLNSPVTEIDYSGNGMKVTAGGRVFEASYALVTVSVGVLKKGGIAFIPKLPREKLEAIDRLQMGNMQKVIVALKKDIFPRDAENSWILYEGDLPKDALSFAREHHLPLVHKRRAVMAFLIKPLNQNIAIGFFGGDWAKALEEQCATAHIEQFSSESKPCDHLSIAITKSALRNMSAKTESALCKMSGKKDTDIDKNIQGNIQVTRWSLDPTSFGAYSAAKPGDWYQRDILAKPVKDDTGTIRLFFAGEGTAEPKYNGTFAGAYESGKRAAGEIDTAMRRDGLIHRLLSMLVRGCGPVGRVFWIGFTAYLAIATIISLGVAGYWLRRAPVASQMLRMATVIAIVGATVSSVILPGNKFESAVTVILIGLAGYFLGSTAKTLPGDNPPCPTAASAGSVWSSPDRCR